MFVRGADIKHLRAFKPYRNVVYMSAVTYVAKMQNVRLH
jgi:hypothetical protein